MPPSRRRLTEEDQSLVARLHLDGQTVTSLTKQFGVSRAVILQALSEQGVRYRSPEESTCQPDQEEIERRKREVQETGFWSKERGGRFVPPWDEATERQRRGASDDPYELPTCIFLPGR